MGLSSSGWFRNALKPSLTLFLPRTGAHAMGWRVQIAATSGGTGTRPATVGCRSIAVKTTQRGGFGVFNEFCKEFGPIFTCWKSSGSFSIWTRIHSVQGRAVMNVFCPRFIATLSWNAHAVAMVTTSSQLGYSRSLAACSAVRRP